MKQSRREFLKKVGVRGGIGVLAVSSTCGVGLCVDDQNMESVTVKEGEVLCDLHAHPANYDSVEEMVAMLTSPGLVGLGHNAKTKRNLTYEQALQLFEGRKDFDELTPKKLARVGDGYFCRAQEISPNDHLPFEILAFGFEGDYFTDERNTVDTIKAVHGQGGRAIVVHGYVQNGGLFGYKLINEEQERTLIDLYHSEDDGKPDAIEAHNAQLISIWPLFSFNEANVKATEFSERYNIPGIASSDAHRVIRQVKLCGVGIEKKIVESGMEAVKKAVSSGDFTRYGNDEDGPYVSALSLAKGRFFR